MRTNSLVKKPRNLYALTVLNKYLCDLNSFEKQFNDGALRCDKSDHSFLCEFVTNPEVKNYLMLTDSLVGQDGTPNVRYVRPTERELCDSLTILSDLWIQLEDYVMQTPEDDRPEAHELYDLLADVHVRELLVAYDDIANQRYIMEDVDLVPIYTEMDDDYPNALISTSNLDELSSVLTDQSVVMNDPSRFDEPKSVRSNRTHTNNAHIGKGNHSLPQVEKRQQANQPQNDRPFRVHQPTMGKTKLQPDKFDNPHSVTSEEDQGVNDAHSMRRNNRQLNKTLPGKLNDPKVQDVTRSPKMSINSGYDSHASPTLSDSLSLDRPKSNRKSSGQTVITNSLPDRQARHSRSSRGTHPDDHQHNKSLLNKSDRTKLPTPGVPRYVNLRRDHPGENLGFTVAVRTPPPDESDRTSAQRTNQSEIAIQRILIGSLADRQGELYPGDVLLEVNGCRVNNLEEVFTQIQRTANSLECKLLVQAPKHGLIPSGLQIAQNLPRTKRFIRCLFEYDASKDSLLPSANIGLSFTVGDVLELLDDQDPNWWQVRSLNDPNGKTRLIPSQTIEERRQAFNQEKSQDNKNNRKTKRKTKTFFRAANASGLRLRSDIWSYEEVVPWPKSVIPCLLLLGPTGVGRRTLKVLLAKREPKRFAYPMSDTTDPTASTSLFRIVPKDQMENDVRSGAYVEWGKVGNHLYGIRFAELRRIVGSGRTVVLDCLPESVHLLHQPEFNPCSIFVAAPSFEIAKIMLQEGLKDGLTTNNRSDDELRAMIDQSESLSARYRHLYFHLLINKNMEESVEKLSRLTTKLQKQPCWIPCGWAYELSTPHRSNDGTPFIPGSSSLSALGIHGLPPSSRSSVLARSVFSGVSEESAESASRLARPPSICSGPIATPTVGANLKGRLYEKRRRSHTDYQHHIPTTISEHDTPSESGRSVNAASRVVAHTPTMSNQKQPNVREQMPATNRNRNRYNAQTTDFVSESEDSIRSPHSSYRSTGHKSNPLTKSHNPVVVSPQRDRKPISDVGQKKETYEDDQGFSSTSSEEGDDQTIEEHP